ncbi:alpha/beta fold hydrolase [Dokdonella sp.]|uniref:alpha/beta fold hydrolase n=1 Tax=Dokdonella sp. TaxID=2291710 RepID=UPI0027BACE82|nr:alpha/beta fold hydrolase [Dokdonella sp.]
MIEEVPLDLGGGLTGILTRPAQPTTRPLWILLNAGFIPRSGPFRLHVDLARALARDGIAVLRVDQPGVGNAPPKRGDDVAVLVQGLDRLCAISGASRFVLGGLCSAADQAWKVALTDARVCGLLLLDPYAARGAWFRLGQLRLLLGRGGSAVRTVWRRLRRRHVAALGDRDLRDWPDPAAARRQAAQLVARGVALLALYTGGAAAYFTDRRQFAATYGASARSARVRLHHWPDCDHMFMRHEDRQRLQQAIIDWARALA